ncbi:family 78 glycoside hydrolase catalytic domain [Paenibacillus sp. GD4]|uniref:family 78 glycoside hydrolase catalytic domain n=1 Tax=Paenibacillus sp. GD4 TaxID=3068890 RepID=UPI0027963F5D|nr:family 78 glycoside hydrolase catalytic domain [Paenibacillus sp. GD4]MDQ1914865.1 family 78 glycoside hydrolase catalytic domain [Paenibacillus sp. GD4]
MNNRVRITKLRVENRCNPIGIDAEAPRFSWIMEADERGQKQTAYQILVTSELSGDSADVWNSGKVLSNESVAIVYTGEALQPSTRYYWTVMVWDKDGQVFIAEEQAYFETGVRSTDGITGWSGAKWITMNAKTPKSPGAPMFRKETKLRGKVKHARLYISALGVYDAYLNGQKLGIVMDDGRRVYEHMPPGWTNFDRNNTYMTYDVTSYMKDDVAVLGAILGNGWWNGRISKAPGSEKQTVYYNDEKNELALFCKLLITYEDGSTQAIVTDTDSGWKAADTGPVREDDIYDGETYDATMEIEGWAESGFNDAQWQEVKEHRYRKDFPHASVTAYHGETAQIVDALDQVPQAITTYTDIIAEEETANGRGKIKVDPARTITDTEAARRHVITVLSGDTVIYDLGQNMVGVPRVIVEGPKGTQVRIRYAEMLNDESKGADGPVGSIYVANLRKADVTDYYTLKGASNGETYQPAFTYHGFRYVEITVAAGESVTIHGLTGKVVRSAIPETGSIETSHRDVNQLFSNIMWGHRGNYLWIPTDCPQRNERVGWSGDTQLFANTALYNMEAALFLENWMDMFVQCQETYGNGAFTSTAPSGRYANFRGFVGNGGWADAGIVVPWTVWQMTGDTMIIEKNYAAMNRFMDWIYDQTGETYRGTGSIGDWLNFQGTDRQLMSDVYYVYDAILMAGMAGAIGKTADVRKYEALHEKIRQTFIKHYIHVDENGALTVLSSGGYKALEYDDNPDQVGVENIKMEDNSQASLLWCLKLGLYENEDQRQQMIHLLTENIKNSEAYKTAHPESSRVNYAENTLSVGFLGVNVIAPVLSDVGQSELAYKLLLQDAMPSWLYSVKNGATTVWERWNSYSVEDGFGDVRMNSFNHYAYGAIAEWMYKYMAGIANDPAQPGFKHIILRPEIDLNEQITWVKGSYDSVRGTIRSEWKVKGNNLSYAVTIPANTTATLYLPSNHQQNVSEGGKPVQEAEGIHFIAHKNGKAIYELGAGSYTFESVLKP